jgi:YhcH/YjgK/YiaL family protein
MIYAKLSEARAYRGIHPALDMALEHMTQEFMENLTDVTQQLDGERVYATRFTYETLPAQETYFEAHRQYLDIHIMVAGQERVEIGHPEELTLFEHRDDFYAYRGQGFASLVLKPGEFLVVFPRDAHRIKMQVDGPETVSKAVFKAKIH